MAMPTRSYTCPVCHMTSYNENDVLHQYCGNCHQFTGNGPRMLCVPAWEHERAVRANWTLTIGVAMNAAIIAIAITRLIQIYYPVNGTRNFLVGFVSATFTYTAINLITAQAKYRKSKKQFEEMKAQLPANLSDVFDRAMKRIEDRK